MAQLSNHYGKRYLSAREFSSFCSDSNVDLDVFNRDLELFEREGILLPVARIIKPSEYVALRKQLDSKAETYGQALPAWGDLERLHHLEGSPQANSEERLWHPFDQELHYHNPFLSRPSRGEFKPWKLYWEAGEAVESYYHYWQVHQVQALLENYPTFVKDNWILKSLRQDVQDRARFLVPTEVEPRLTIGGKTVVYDALSFYIQLHKNERWRTFSEVPEVEGIRRLTEEQYETYRVHQAAHAQWVATQYKLSASALYEFLMDLLELKDRYEQRELLALAAQLRNDLRYLWTMIAHITGQSFDDISRSLAKRGLIGEHRFRGLEEEALIQDCVRDYFSRLSESYAQKLPSRSFPESDVNDLLRFVFTSDLFLLPHAIYEIHKTRNDPQAQDMISLYVGMKNLATSFEYFLREIARRSADAGLRSNLNDSRRNTLRPLVRSMMQGEAWTQLFDSSRDLGRATSPEGFIDNIIRILGDPQFSTSEQNEIARFFLLVENARNVTVHFFTIEDRLFGNLRGPLFTAVIYGIMYTWQFAKSKGWLTVSEKS